ncbi:hypothetical protein [uncultured Friedmanniella sp.]|uniref:hypothetical protein n=1 Tax=uncultured Friedmanniella sp. TaxID=335381 RepID=UPI0035CB6CFB
MTAAARFRTLLTSLLPTRDDAQAGERLVAIKARLDAANEYDDPWPGSEWGRAAAATETYDGETAVANAPADITFLLARVAHVEAQLRLARTDLESAADTIGQLEDAVNTVTAAQWAAADEAENLRGQVAELLPWAAHGVVRAIANDSCLPEGLVLWQAVDMGHRIEAGEFGETEA